MAERFLDGLGLPFADVQPADRYASVKIVRKPKLRTIYKREWGHCQLCGRQTGNLEAHHIVAGARKSDERTNLICLCPWGACHELVQHSPDWLAVVLYMKWWLDRDNLSWQRLTDLKGSRLPRPVRDAAIIRTYRNNRGL